MSATLPPVHADAVRRPRRSLRFVRDEELVRLVRAGDRCAFEAVYDRHARGILSFCRHMLGSREEAEDAVQHTFAAAYRDLSSNTRPIQLKAWLYTIARNRSLSILRARKEERALDDVPEPSVEGLSSQVQRRQDLRDMLADLQRLPEEQRAALVLAELGALSHEEIAVTLDVRKEKVKALVFQARESLASSRRARDADCGEIQEQLAVLRGGSLRRTELRRHVAVCPSCSAFKAEVSRQRAAMALVLPVAPTMALKQAALGAAAAAGAGAGAGAAGGGGLLTAVGAKSLAAKVVAIAAVAGGATGGGLMAVDELRTPPPGDARSQGSAAPAAASPVRLVERLRAADRGPDPAVTPTAGGPAAPADRAQRRRAGRTTGSRRRDGAVLGGPVTAEALDEVVAAIAPEAPRGEARARGRNEQSDRSRDRGGERRDAVRRDRQGDATADAPRRDADADARLGSPPRQRRGGDPSSTPVKPKVKPGALPGADAVKPPAGALGLGDEGTAGDDVAGELEADVSQALEAEPASAVAGP